MSPTFQALTLLAALLAGTLYALLVAALYRHRRSGDYHRRYMAYRITAAGNVMIAITTAALMGDWVVLWAGLAANIAWGLPQVLRNWHEESQNAAEAADRELTDAAL